MDPQPTEKLPGIIGLINEGIHIYKEQFKTIFRLSLLYLVVVLVMSIGLNAGLVASVFSFSSIGFGGTAVIFLIIAVLFIVFYWLTLRVQLGIMHAIRSHDEHIGFKEAFGRGKNHVWGFIWISILTCLVVLGVVTLIGLIGLLIIVFAGVFLHNLLTLVLGVVLTIVILLALFISGTWFVFSAWVYIDQDARGLHALAISKHLSHKHFWPIFWRLFLLELAYAIVILIIEGICGLLFSSLPQFTATLLSEAISSIVLYLAILPVFFGSLFTLYQSAKSTQVIDTDSKAHGEHRGILMTLAIVGLIGVIALPIGSGVVLAFLSQSRLHGESGSVYQSTAKDNDLVREEDINEIDSSLLLYDADNNAYPDSLAALSNPSNAVPVSEDQLVDPVSHLPYSYTVGSDHQTFKICTTLQRGEPFCATQDGLQDSGPSSVSNQ